ncbi:serine/threonine-protein kinase [Blastopirellula marina]|uniref:non-specific serine/threonine protein kinase n=1 Tax=Blastopirellula marina TaxID=124 RepID=A0A2S8GRQ2_9BACT|nr:serine/threonine-protein kinase [Blastopirellula marina]PQO47109.1 hypothetical protein C5Y93_06360 [Blastopirellula marina]
MTSVACLRTEEVISLLSKDLVPEQIEDVERHLSGCHVCREALAGQIGSEQWWSEAEGSLRSISSDGEDFAFSLCSDASLTDLLGPTDDPHSMGRIGPYEIVGLLGKGGMGVVFKGYDRSLSRYVAIKVMLPHLAASGAARKRFAREGRAAAAVVNDHVLPIYGVNEWQGTPYLVSQYTSGQSLQKRLDEEGPLALEEILRIGLQTATGLAAAHAQGLVHRDIKPSNILLDGTVDRALLTDFGLARAVDDASMTRSGYLAGTPQYMSPEQARGESVDQRSDLFSLGSLLYVMSTGHPPFRAESSLGVLRRIDEEEPRSVRESRADLPPWLEAIIEKLMAKRPEDRYQTADEAAGLLERCLAHLQQPLRAALPPELLSSDGAKSTRYPWRTAALWLMLALLVGGWGAARATGEPAAPIEGRWSGALWDEITIWRDDAGGYRGTYVDRQTSTSGEFMLMWSRMSQRYVGPCQASPASRGELSFQLVDGEIRGTKMIAQAGLNRANPNQAAPRPQEFTWRRTQPLPPDGIFNPYFTSAKAPPEEVATEAYKAIREGRWIDFKALTTSQHAFGSDDRLVKQTVENMQTSITKGPPRLPTVRTWGDQAVAVFDREVEAANQPAGNSTSGGERSEVVFALVLRKEEGSWRVWCPEWWTAGEYEKFKAKHDRWQASAVGKFLASEDPHNLAKPLEAKRVELAQKIYQAIRDGDLEEIEKHLSPRARVGVTKQRLKKTVESLRKSIAEVPLNPPEVFAFKFMSIAAFKEMKTDMQSSALGPKCRLVMHFLLEPSGEWLLHDVLIWSADDFNYLKNRYEKHPPSVLDLDFSPEDEVATTMDTSQSYVVRHSPAMNRPVDVAMEAYEAMHTEGWNDLRELLAGGHSCGKEDELHCSLNNVRLCLQDVPCHTPVVFTFGDEATAVFDEVETPDLVSGTRVKGHFVVEMVLEGVFWRVQSFDHWTTTRFARWQADEVPRRRAAHPPADEQTGSSQVAQLELTFFDNRTRRVIPALLVDVGWGTVAVTAAQATLVPAGMPPAINGIKLLVPGHAKEEVDYLVEYSTPELFFCYTPLKLSASPLEQTVKPSLNMPVVGDPDQLALPSLSNSGHITKLDQTIERVISPWNKEQHVLRDLMVVEPTFPNGTLLFHEGKIVGISLLPVGEDPEVDLGCFVVPVASIQERIAKIRLAGEKSNPQEGP